MKKGLLSSILALAASVFLLAVGLTGQETPPAEAKAKGGFGGKGKGGPPPPPAGPFTRLPDGHPDMQGYWNSQFGNAVTDIQTKGRSPIVDPADAKIPYRPEAAAKAKEIFASRMAEEPELHCFQSGVPHNMWVQFGFQIVQTPNYLVVLWEFMHSYRIIPTDNRPHISPDIKLFQGDSVGHWESDTLVVDTTNHNNKTWMDTSANFKPETVHVVERFTMQDLNTINYEATMTDPSTYTQPWTVRGQFRRQNPKMPDGSRDYEQMEFACIEGNQDLGHYTEDKGGKAKQVLGVKP
jgi:hypothetical protein